MTWKISHDSTLGIVELVLTGAASGEELLEASTAAIGLIRKTGVTRGLIDAADQVETASVADLFSLPSHYFEEGLSHDTRIALVIPERPELHDVTEFYETVCVNRGWTVQRFADRDQATAWLSQAPDLG